MRERERGRGRKEGSEVESQWSPRERGRKWRNRVRDGRTGRCGDSGAAIGGERCDGPKRVLWVGSGRWILPLRKRERERERERAAEGQRRARSTPSSFD